jgi:type VI secretion system secreted protein Hcp
MAALLTLVPLGALAALPAYMWATGETQGVINGSVDHPGRENSMEVVEFSHSRSQAIDSASGLPSGKRQHRPIRVTKLIDKASPKLANALTTNESLTTFRINFYRPGPSGVEQQFYTVELVNARITNISQSIISRNTEEWNIIAAPAIETITLVYDKIIWTWEDGGIAAEDDWIAPTQ